MTKTEIRTVVGGNRGLFDSTFDDLINTGEIGHDKRGRIEAGTTKQRPVWGLTSTRTSEAGPGSSEGLA